MIPPTSIDGTEITGATIDGTDVQEITVDGDTVFTAAPPIPSSAINHWPFDEGSGTVVNDIIGSNDGTINGATFVSGNFYDGFALDFDGSNDNVSLSASSDIDTNKDFSIGVTIEPDNLDANNIAINNTISSGNRVSLGTSFSSGIISFFVRPGFNKGVSIDAAASTNKVRLCATHKAAGNEINLYQNGVDEVDGSENAQSSSATGLTFGSSTSGGSTFDGIIDNVIFYDKVLTNSEIQDDFNLQPWA